LLRLLTAACGTFETSTDVRYTAAFEGKADMSLRLPNNRDKRCLLNLPPAYSIAVM
jgi:hypothetical protein